MKIELDGVKAMSVNEAWQGRKYKTKAYKAYEQEVLYLLKAHINSLTGSDKSFAGEYDLSLTLTFSLPSKSFKLSDLDNFCKPILDIIQKSGIINDDRHIVELELRKVKSDKRKIEIEIDKV